MQIRHAKRGDEAALAFLLDPPPGATLCLVAEREGSLVGFAILNPYFPAADLTHGLYLKELYVTASARSTGEANAGSQRFYDRLGIRREKKVYYVMDGWA